MELYREFGRRLRHARKRAGLSQEDLAERLGVSRAAVANIELGRQRVALHQLVSAASTLGLDPRDLLPFEVPSSSVAPVAGHLGTRDQVAVERILARAGARASRPRSRDASS